MSEREDCLRPLMLVGTGSDVGKSILATALCRIFKQDGYSPAPFKAQNMALNSYATPDGLEIGRAQAVQAEASCLDPHTDMNPVLLKPNSEHTTQVVLHGKPLGNVAAYSYFRHEGREELRKEVCDAFDRLSKRYNPIVMEGAGSVSELNLRDSDIVNLPMARHAKASVILVADIDRGGVFASSYGSIMLQTPEDRDMIKGIIVNKFRGDLRLFDEGKRLLEKICGVPVLGVVPMFSDIVIDPEDSVYLENIKKQGVEDGRPNDTIKVAVVLLRHISNFTDFSVLERDDRVTLFYTREVSDIRRADIIIIPGTKSTMDDLLELRRSGLAKAIAQAKDEGKTIIGICGGFQMLGKTVCDPEGVEGSVPELPGLCVFPLRTTMSRNKVTRQVLFPFDGVTCSGYEIHQGVTSFCHDDNVIDSVRPLSVDDHELPDVLIDGTCYGTYIHGFLDNKAVIDHILKPYTSKSVEVMDIKAFKDVQYDKLAAHVRKYVDMYKLYELLR